MLPEYIFEKLSVSVFLIFFRYKWLKSFPNEIIIRSIMPISMSRWPLFVIYIMSFQNIIFTLFTTNIVDTTPFVSIIIFFAMVCIRIYFTPICMYVWSFLWKYLLEASGKAAFLLSGSTSFLAEPGQGTFLLSCWKSLLCAEFWV